MQLLTLVQLALGAVGAVAGRKLPADLQFDLILPRNDSYAPTQFMP